MKSASEPFLWSLICKLSIVRFCSQARARAAAAATKPAALQQPVSARSQDTLAGVPPLGSSPAVAIVREEEPDDWDITEDTNAGRAGAKSAAPAAATGSGSGAAFTATIGAPSVQEQVAVRPGGIVCIWDYNTIDFCDLF